MLFNSWGYIVALLLIIPLHWALPHRFRIYLIASCSILFYGMWRWDFTFLMIFTASVDYFSSLKIYQSKDERTRKTWLWSTLIINLGLLAYFKYTYFVYGNIQEFANMLGLHLPALTLEIILPLGISFYTFHSISYTIDVYRGVIVPTNNYVLFLAFVTSWPQLMAGPILRADEVIPQIKAERILSGVNITNGIERIIVGLFKKVVIADYIAQYVDAAYSINPASLTSFDTWVATFLFGYQIYFDFAGYSDMAVGSAKLIGINFPENFNWPYMSLTPKEFWKRWHISLSSWIRDYLYLPLTGQKFKTSSTGGISVATDDSQRSKATYALFLTWLIMGLWHGAAWSFAAWGLYHASLIYIYRKIPIFDLLANQVKPLAWILMLLFSMASWIFFRCQSMSQAMIMYGKIFSPSAYTFSGKAISADAYYLALTVTVTMVAINLLSKTNLQKYLYFIIQPLKIAAMVYLIIIFMRPNAQFIYFQF